MIFVGMDHGTTGISFTIIESGNTNISYNNNDNDNNNNNNNNNNSSDKVIANFKISREDSKSGKVSAINELSKVVDLDSIDLMAITYAMGDGISSIMPIKNVKNRGILSIEGAGKVTGGGTSVYTEIENSNIPTVLIPGLHKNSPVLDEKFRAAYSHHASSEKISICYNTYLATGWNNMIVADISSNSVCLLIQEGEIKGAIDACLGAMGIVHGPIDLEMIREIDEGKKSANEAFSRGGAVKIANINEKVAFIKDKLISSYEDKDENAILAINTLAMTVAMEIWSLIGVAEEVDGIVLTGSIGSSKAPFDFEDIISEYFKNKPIQPNIKVIGIDSGSLGSAEIARDIYNGKKDILGIDVEDIDNIN
ncbi:MAG: methanogenesis marker 12 protein [Methanobacteriaceae archaeon]